MDPETVEVFKFVGTILPYVAIIVALCVGGWVFTTWLRIKNGYPLETSWGVPVHPKTDQESLERIRLLTTEMKTILSMPSTISMALRATRAMASFKRCSIVEATSYSRR